MRGLLAVLVLGGCHPSAPAPARPIGNTSTTPPAAAAAEAPIAFEHPPPQGTILPTIGTVNQLEVGPVWHTEIDVDPADPRVRHVLGADGKPMPPAAAAVELYRRRVRAAGVVDSDFACGFSYGIQNDTHQVIVLCGDERPSTRYAILVTSE